MNTIPIFCINLARASERRELMIKLWKNNLNIDIIFWNGIDRRDIENKTITNDLIQNLQKNSGLKCGEIGYLLSNLYLADYCLKNNIEEYIIIEDDIYPSEYCDSYETLNKLIDEGKQEFKEACIFLLFAPHNKFHYNIRKNSFSSMKNTPWGNQLIYFNKIGSEKIQKSLLECKYPADHWHRMKYINIRTDMIISNIPMGYHEHKEDTTTYIGNGRRKFIR